MKKTVLFTLFYLCVFSSYLFAQPAQQLVTVMVSPDKTDWKYKANQEVTFTVQVFQDDNLVKDVEIDYELGPEFFPTVKKQKVKLKDGKTTLKAKMKEPGFLQCKVTAHVNGKKYQGLATAAYDEDQILPTTANPADFDAFWMKAIEDARKNPLDPKLTLIPEKCTSIHDFYHISFQNEQPGSRMYGILTVPKKEGKYPAVLQVPGAGIRPYHGSVHGDDIITLEVGIHGLPVNLPNEVYNSMSRGAVFNYMHIHKNDRDAHYYKRVYLGCVRAVDFIYELPEFDGENIAVTGGSQGGALSIVVAGLDKRIKCLAAFYPALCDYAGYLNKRAGGWPHYYRNAQPGPGEVETLAYFDVVNFARRVEAPGWYSWGFNDTVCPPTSMHAAYNVIPAGKELHLFPRTGHWTYPEQRELSGTWLRDQLFNK